MRPIRLRVAVADLGVRRRFIAALETCEACEACGRWCPPRLDDPPWAFDPDPDKPAAPPLDTPLRFDEESWRKVTAGLHGRACACRTIGCVDGVGVAIDQLEPGRWRRSRATRSRACRSHARECLYRLRGKTARVPQRPVE
jgi:hypothetical protein